MDIIFPCDHCGKNLVADEEGKGKTADCPSCGKPVVVPMPVAAHHTTPLAKRTVVRIPHDALRTTQIGKPPDAPMSVAVPLTPDTRYVEIVVGWVCVVVGTVLALLLPHAVLVYAPFFLGAFLMALVLLATDKVLHGLVLLLCTCVPPPLLMHQDIWRHEPARSASASSKVQKLVFGPDGAAQLVSADEAPQESAQAPVPEPARRAADEPRSQRAEPPAPPAEPPDFSPPAPPPPKTAAKHAKAEYRDLLESQAEIPPLIPEDVLAQTQIGHGSDFRWQESTPTLAPGDPAPVVDMPFVVYSDGGIEGPYAMTGRLGNKAGLPQLDDSWDAAPHSGKTCIYVRYEDRGDWVTVAWQNPGNNWGEVPGGFNLSKASKLTFWAKGESGSEEVEFMVGMEQPQNAVSRDSFRATTGKVRLKKDWRKYTIPIEKLDRTRLITGFLFRIEGQGKPVVFFLDDIQFE